MLNLPYDKGHRELGQKGPKRLQIFSATLGILFFFCLSKAAEARMNLSTSIEDQTRTWPFLRVFSKHKWAPDPPRALPIILTPSIPGPVHCFQMLVSAIRPISRVSQLIF